MPQPQTSPQHVIIIGGGPAGLMAAYKLRRLGYQVTLFEATDALGGALRLYLPAFRLPREVLDREAGLIEHMGAEIRLRTRLGRDLHLEDLRRDFAAVFLALGAHKGLSLQIPGEDLSQVWPVLDFLRAANSGTTPPKGRCAANCEATRLDRIRRSRRTATAVSSQEDSRPKTSKGLPPESQISDFHMMTASSLLSR